MNERCNQVAKCSCCLLDLRTNRMPDDQHRSASHDDWAHACCLVSACVSGRQPARACHDETSQRRHAPRKLTRRGHTWMAHSVANCNMETQAKEQHHLAPCAIERRLKYNVHGGHSRCNTCCAPTHQLFSNPGAANRRLGPEDCTEFALVDGIDLQGLS